MATNIITQTDYDFKSPRVYADDVPSEGIYYTSSAVTIDDNTAIPRFTALYDYTGNGGGIYSPIVINQGTAQQGTTKRSEAVKIEDTRNVTVGVLGQMDLGNPITNHSFNRLKSVYIYGGSQYSLPPQQEVTLAEFTNGVFTTVVTFEGKAYVDISQKPNTYVTQQVNNDITYTADTDYTVNDPVLSDDGQNLTMSITLVEGSALATYLATEGASISVSFTPYQLNVELKEGIDYKVSYGINPSNNRVMTYVDLIAPEGYNGISGTVRLNYVKDTITTGDPTKVVITIHDTSATDPRTVAVWTAGYFDGSSIPNFSPAFNATPGMSFH